MDTGSHPSPEPGQEAGQPTTATPTPPQVPHVEAPTTPEGVSAIGAEFAKLRAEMAAFREAIAKQAPAVARALPVLETEAERAAARLAEVAAHSHYCPGCGLLYDYLRECVGRREAPHPAITVVSTDEIKSGDPSKHTPAPNTDRLAA